MKFKNILLLTSILVSLFSFPAVLADEFLEVEFDPNTWTAGTTREVTLTLSNKPTSGVNIVNFELTLPLDESGNLVYDVKNDVVLPAGFDYQMTIKGGKPEKIILTATGVGLRPGKTADIVLNFVTAPERQGQTFWSWTAQTDEDETDVGQVTTDATFGELKALDLSGVPADVGNGESFEITVSVIDEFDLVKKDYVGMITVTSTDDEASIAPMTYTFKEDDAGEKVISIRFRTAGNQKITVTDKNSGIGIRSVNIEVHHKLVKK